MTLRIRQIIALLLTLSLVLVMTTGVMAGKSAGSSDPAPMIMADGMDCPSCPMQAERSTGCAQLHCGLPVAEQAAFDAPMPGGCVFFTDPARLFHQADAGPSPRPA